MTAFDDLDDYLALPRVTRLVMSPDGTRLILAQSTLDDTGTSFVGALWEIDPVGGEPARRLTQGEKGESNPTFTARGDLLFTATRGGEDEPPSLWRLPAAGGEAEKAVARSGGVAGVHAATRGDRIVLTANVLGHSDTDDERVRAARKDRKVSAVMHTGYPVRYWDHDLGPDRPHLLTVGADGELTDLTPGVRSSLRDAQLDVAADGSFAASTWIVAGPLASRRTTLVRVDLTTGLRTPLVDDDTGDATHPVLSPDGTKLAYLHESLSDPDTPPQITLRILDIADGVTTVEARDWDRRPTSIAWLPDGAGLVLTADEKGRGPVFVLRSGADRPEHSPSTTPRTPICPSRRMARRCLRYVPPARRRRTPCV